MSYADDMKKLQKYKLQKRKELNKKYPNGGKDFIKAVNELKNLTVAKFKNMSVTPVTTKTVKAKIETPTKKPNIIKAKTTTTTTKTKPKKTETKTTTKKKDTGPDAMPMKRPSSIRPKSVTEKKTKDVKMVTLKDGSKGTIAQRLAEIDKEKEIAMKEAKFKSPTEAKKRSDYFGKLASSLKTKKAARGGAMMKKKMMGGGYSTKKKK
jgi:hypothetical protein